MRFISAPWLFLLLIAVPSAWAAVGADCKDCDVADFASRALALGVGVHALYDAAEGSVRTFSVTREPRDGGGHRYDVRETAPDQGSAGFFSQANDYYRTQGKARRAMQVALPYLASNFEHADDSVFDLFHNIGAGSNQFGLWLANYMKAQAIPVVAPTDLKHVLKLQEAHVGIRYGSDLDRKTVRVVFADGEAEFELSTAGDTYRYKNGTAFDLDGHPIPESPGDALAHGAYEFPSGAQSASFRGFQALIAAWQIPSLGIRYDWQCVPAAQGLQRCSLVDNPREAGSDPSHEGQEVR